MIIDFRKIPKEEFEIDVKEGEVSLKARVFKKKSNLLVCQGKISGTLEHHCDRCGAPLPVALDEAVEVWISDGAIPLEEEGHLLNLVEFFDGRVDFCAILHSEVEAIKSDYFYCQTCEN
ncbi:DNA-binding protein [Sulfurospirillum sp. T05]|uniref:DNA-binding protein n=1 Tax=Sulfurospirillum tamanense TaxID=2813362 RepID=A0ABS2WP19_9BACT|nr:DNA-binding protein [Sulfurospirillum tamanensis]MBN2963431.1 DNA-binding protein [Sulfurospirillum tamanensis]